MRGNEILQFIRSRRSVRRFQSRAVPAELFQDIIETAMWAPSAHNRQPWRFAVVESAALKLRLAELMGAEFRRDLQRDGQDPSQIDLQIARSQQRIQAAPLLVILCLDPTDLDTYPDPVRSQAEHLMAVQSVAMAGGYLLLAAHAHGLGGVWMCAPLFASAAVTQALDLPPQWKPQGMLLIGYPDSVPPPRPRRPLVEIARYY